MISAASASGTYPSGRTVIWLHSVGGSSAAFIAAKGCGSARKHPPAELSEPPSKRSAPRPFTPQQRRERRHSRTAALGKLRTLAPQQIGALFDHVVGTAEQRQRQRKSKCPGG